MILWQLLIESIPGVHSGISCFLLLYIISPGNSDAANLLWSLLFSTFYHLFQNFNYHDHVSGTSWQNHLYILNYNRYCNQIHGAALS